RAICLKLLICSRGYLPLLLPIHILPPLPAPTGPAAGVHGGRAAQRRRLPGGHRAPSAARRSPGSGPRLLAGPACVCRCFEALWGGQLGGVASLFSFPLGWWETRRMALSPLIGATRQGDEAYGVRARVCR